MAAQARVSGVTMASGLPDFHRGVDVALQSLAEVTNRPKYGAATYSSGNKTVSASGRNEKVVAQKKLTNARRPDLIQTVKHSQAHETGRAGREIKLHLIDQAPGNTNDCFLKRGPRCVLYRRYVRCVNHLINKCVFSCNRTLIRPIARVHVIAGIYNLTTQH